MAEVELPGGIKFKGGKIFVILTALTTAGGALWGGFEFYKDYLTMKEQIQEYVAPDLSGFDKNIAVMKETGHNNFHEFLKKMGMQEIYGRKAAATFEDYGQEISKAMTEGITYTEKAGPGLAGTVVPPDPELVNQLFGMLDIYAKQNKFMRNILKKGEVTLDSTKNARRVTPKGDLTYDLKKSPSLLFRDRKPELLGDRMRKIEAIQANNK